MTRIKVKWINSVQWSSSVNQNLRSVLLIGLLLCSMMTYANLSGELLVQDNVTGTVIDNTESPLPGVTVLVEGTTTGVTTDFDGHYTISATQGDVLVFSYVGMKTVRVTVENDPVINVTLEEDLAELDEVIVVGYGSVKKSDLTGSVAVIKPDENEALKSSSINEVLQGKVAGLNVTNSSGVPGESMSVRIRGTNSLRSDNEPLYVIDGVIMNSITEDASNPFNTPNDFQSQQSGLSGINPGDIASVQVLKDASATAIYGSRGANGVVIITTKKGSKGKTRVRVSTSSTATFVGRSIDLLGPNDYSEMANSGAILSDARLIYGFYGGDIYTIQNVPDGDEYFNDPANAALTPSVINNYDLQPSDPIDWIDEMTGIGVSTSSRVAISGGSEDFTYYLATGLNTLEGVFQNSGVNTGDIRSNMNFKLSDRIKIASTLSANYRTNDMNLSSDGVGTRGLMNSILNAAPFDGAFFYEFGEKLPGPRLWISDYYDNSKESRIIASLRADVKLADFLTYQLKLSGNVRTKERVRFYTDQVGVGSIWGGYLGESNLNSKNYSIENLLQFNKTFSKAHTIGGTLGFTIDEFRTTTKSLFGNDFSDFILGENGMRFARTITYNNPREIPKNYVSALGRINYSLLDKYLLTYTFRRDGVSVFNGDKKWDNFHSFALAWKLGEEKFIKDLGVISELKLRAGWGQTGNSSIAPFQTLDLYGVNLGSDLNGGNVIGLVPSGIANPALIWESTVQTNVGLDWGLLKGRIKGSVDAYIKTTEDLLLNKPIPSSNGFTTTTINVGEIENKGLEFMIDANIINNNKFRWSIGANIAFNKNKIIDLGDEDSFGDGRAHFFGNQLGTFSFTQPVNIFIENEPIGMFWGLKTNGLYRTQADLVDAPLYGGAPELGDVRFEDLNDDGVIDGFDKQIIGNPNPDYTYGFDTEFSYNNLSLRLVFTGKQGNDVFNAKLSQNGFNDKLASRNVYAETWLDRWTPENINGRYPRQGFNLSDASDVVVEDGSFLRLATATLNYSLPSEFLSGIGVNDASIYLTGNNLLLFSKYRGFDPEVSSFAYDGTRIGIDWASNPRPISFTLGVNINF